MRSNRGLNPFIRGWAAYYRTVVSSEVFQSLDAHVWRLVYKWASFTHPKKPKRWIIDRYFGQFNPHRRDRWVFGDRDSGAYTVKFAWDGNRPPPAGQGLVVSGRSSPRTVLGRPATQEDPTAGQNTDSGCSTPNTAGAQPAVDFLLHADHEPQSPHEWQLWLSATKKAIDRQAIAHDVTGLGRRDNAPHHRPHTRILPTSALRPTGSSPTILHHQRAHAACLSRMRR